MAWNHEGNRVRPVCGAHGPDGLWLVDGDRDIGIGNRLAVPDLGDLPVDGLLEFRRAHVEIDLEDPAFTRGVLEQLVDRRIVRGSSLDHLGISGVRSLPTGKATTVRVRKFYIDQTIFTTHDAKRSDRGFEAGGEERFHFD